MISTAMCENRSEGGGFFLLIFNSAKFDFL